ncbi:MAG: amidohydrolase [Bacteroidia bacterium]|nr:amidohydrolase [Bacteroidia bacterium]
MEMFASASFDKTPVMIDVHTHIIPKHIPDFSKKFGYGEFIQLHHHEPGKAWMMQGNKKFREILANCWDPEIRLMEMKEHGISSQVICTIPVMFSYWAKPEHTLELSKFLNDHIAEIVHQYHGSFIGLGTVPMQDVPLAVKEMERCKKNGLKGLQIGTNVNQVNLNEPVFYDFYEACQEQDMALLVHPWQMMGQEHMQKYWLPWLVGMPAEITRAICSMIFGGIFDRFPKLRVCFAHGGGSFVPTLGRIEHGWECRPDLVAVDNPNNPASYLGKFWVDSHVCDSEILNYLVGKLGADKIMQGSDYPFPLGEAVPGELVRKSISDKTLLKKIAYENALAWLNIN